MSAHRDTPGFEAEVMALGSVVLGGAAAYDEMAEILAAEDFGHAGHAAIWRAAGRLVDRRQPVDAASLLTEIEGAGDLAQAGGAEYVCGLGEAAATSVNCAHHARVVRGYARLRTLAAACVEGAQAARSSRWHEAEDAVDRLFDALMARFPGGAGRRVTLREVAREVGAELREIYQLPLAQRAREVIGVPSGVRSVDAFTRGFRPGHLYVLGARPAMGKTAVGIAWACGAARAGWEALYASAEIPARDIGIRVFGAESGLNTEALETGGVADEELGRLHGATVRLAQYADRVHILDMPRMTVAAVQREARRVKRSARTERGLGLVVVDYLQLIRPARPGRSRENEIAAISAGLLEIARMESMPVLALCQLNRECEKRPDKRPMLSDLRESGSIEQDASVVMFLYRDEVYRADTERRGVADVLIRKNRLGRCGAPEMHFDRTCQRVADLERRHERP